MRMRFALSALMTAIVLAVSIGGNATAASADTSALSVSMDDNDCC